MPGPVPWANLLEYSTYLMPMKPNPPSSVSPSIHTSSFCRPICAAHTARAIVKLDAARIDIFHHLADVVDRERALQFGLAHASAGGVGHFGILHMKPRGREIIERSGVVEMHVGDDQRLDGLGTDAGVFQGFARQLCDRTATGSGFFVIETTIDHDRAAGVADHPDKKVDGHGRGVVIVHDEVVAPPAILHFSVFHRQHFVGFRV